MIVFFRKVFHFLERKCLFKKGRMELGKRLRQAREEANLSVNEVADYLGVGRAQVWRMETKNADAVTIERLRKLADRYGRPMGYFFDDNVEFSEAEVAYQVIGMAIAATETVASEMKKRPSPEALRAATLAVVRAQQKRWADDPNRRFNPDEFVALIEQHFNESKE